jgi:nucleoside phosphorylase
VWEETLPQGTIYEVGKFSSTEGSWDVAVIELGASNVDATLQAARAIQYLNPRVVLSVGIAAGLGDISIGDVVVASKVYRFEVEGAKANFIVKPDLGHSSYLMEQRARAEARKKDWLQRISPTSTERLPRVIVAPIVAGEKIVKSSRGPASKFIQSHFSDAVAVEMEGRGFLDAIYANQNISVLLMRGISDFMDRGVKSQPKMQEIASQNASAFAFEVLGKLRRSDEAMYRDHNATESNIRLT